MISSITFAFDRGGGYAFSTVPVDPPRYQPWSARACPPPYATASSSVSPESPWISAPRKRRYRDGHLFIPFGRHGCRFATTAVSIRRGLRGVTPESRSCSERLRREPADVRDVAAGTYSKFLNLENVS
jgi:hypothetical protein